MELSPEPDLPVPLPRPLSDPLRPYRWIVFFTLVALVVGLLLPNIRTVREAAAGARSTNNLKQMSLAVQDYASANSSKVPTEWVPDSGGGTFNSGADANLPSGTSHSYSRTLRDTADLAAFAALFTVLLCTFFILPRRATNAVYLRSFHNDATTGGLRTTAQAALGRAFRLSGIRDPRRRWSVLIRHLLYILFLIRYAQPKFMNLEAGHDWKARLWRSLGKARCALIDVTELTPFVREEVQLAIRCLGFHRVLFIGNDSRTADEWRLVILTALESPDVPPQRLRVALWADTAAGQAAFRDQVRAFADRLPADPPGLNAAAFPETAPSSDPGGNAVTGESWRTFLLATLIGTAITGALLWAQKRTPDAGLAWFLPAAIYFMLAFLLLLQYFAECGSLGQRLRIGGTFLFAAVLAGCPVVMDFLRNTANRVTPENNLRQMTLAVHDSASAHNSDIPPVSGYHPPDGLQSNAGDKVSVFLLPYIEQDNLRISRAQNRTVWPASGGGQQITISQYNGYSLRNNDVKIYMAPADASLLYGVGSASYPANELATGWSNRINSNYVDGLSSTVFIAEHHAVTQQQRFGGWTSNWIYNLYRNDWTQSSDYSPGDILGSDW